MLGGVNPKDLSRYLAISQVGLEMAAPAGIGAALDYYMGWGPWGVIVGAVLGLTVGLIHLVRLANQPVDEKSDDPKAT
jgi:F0F1-type ATP synthase assembly protein I